MRNINFFLFIGFCVLNASFGQVIQSGGCPEVNVVQDFKIDDYIGTWYANAHYPAKFHEGGKCLQAVYTKQDDKTIAAANTKVNKDTNEKTTSNAIGTVIESGKLYVKFPQAEESGDPNYLILGTNYKDYAVVFYCRGLPDDKSSQLLWILTRERNPSENILEDAYKIIDENKLTKDPLIKVDQTNCPEN